MEKIIVDLGYVNSYIKIKFGLIVKNEQYKQNLISKFDFSGNQYIKISPIPTITLEISTGNKNEPWAPNRTLSLSKINIYLFTKRLEEVLNHLKSEKNMFYLDEFGELILNKELASKSRETIELGSKFVCFQPFVVKDKKDSYEGCVMMINDATYPAFMTFEEMQYLITYLRNIDLDNLAINVLNTQLLMKNMESDKVDNVMVEKQDRDLTRSNFITQEQTLPIL